MPSMKLIVNPVAGRGAGGRRLPTICQALQREGLEYDLVRTQEPLQAVALARQAKVEGYDETV